MTTRPWLPGLLLLAACAGREPAPSPPQAPAPREVPAPPPPRELPAPVAVDTEAEARAFVDDLAHQRWEAAAERLDPGLARAAPEAELAALFRKLEEAGGGFRGVEGAESTVESELRLVRVTCRFARLRKVLRVVFGEGDRIAGLFFGPVPRDLEDAARGLVDRLSRGDYPGASSGFDTLMKGTLPPDKLRAVWTQVTRKNGKFAEITAAAIAPAAGGLWSVLLTCRFGEGPLVVKVVYALGDRGAGLVFPPGAPPARGGPPPYAQRDRFAEREVSVGASPPLPGTLTLPRGAGPFP